MMILDLPRPERRFQKLKRFINYDPSSFLCRNCTEICSSSRARKEDGLAENQSVRTCARKEGTED